MVLRKVCTCGKPILVRATYCRECSAKRANAYYAKNKDKVLAANKRRREANPIQSRQWHNASNFRLKIEVLKHYSPDLVCERCGEKDILVLSVDHINGGGNKQKKELGLMGGRFYQWLKNNNYPSGFRVLCMNCQWRELWKAKIERGGYGFLKQYV